MVIQMRFRYVRLLLSVEESPVVEVFAAPTSDAVLFSLRRIRRVEAALGFDDTCLGFSSVSVGLFGLNSLLYFVSVSLAWSFGPL